MPVEKFLARRPAVLAKVKAQLQTGLRGAGQINAAMPFLIRDLEPTGLPVEFTDAASVAWARWHFGVEKTHCYDAALQGRGFTDIAILPSRVLEITPSNGRSKQKANVDGNGTPTGAKYRANQRLPKHLRQRDPAPGHSDRHQRYGSQMISTGDIVRLETVHGTVVSRIKIARQGKGVMTTDRQQNLSAPMSRCQLIARNPRHLLRWKPPSQQKHQPRKRKATAKK